MERAEVVVVGAGPGGLGAVAVLAEGGADVLVVDEQRASGGQIWRQPPPELGDGAAAGRETIAAAVGAAGVRWAHSTTVWAILGLGAPLDPFGGAAAEGVVLAVSGPDGIRRIAAERILIASGAYDLPVPFPGWTLPGVMGAGGVQAFIKSQKLLPGRRFVLAGAHPLLLTIADQILAAGGELALVALCQDRPGPRDALRALPALPGNLGRLADSGRSLRRLRRAGVPIELERVVVRADGTDGLEAVVVASVDGDWRVRSGTERRIECDTLALGYGFVPSTELARQAGCACTWNAEAGGWVVVHDEWLRTTRTEIFAAGEITGVAGAEQALEEGRAAAVEILHDLGKLDGRRARARRRRAVRALRASRRFSRAVQRQFSPRHDALAQLVADDTVVCRCEGITAGQLTAALADNPDLGTADAVKLLTRVGMGPCQGRSCTTAVSHLVAAATGRPVEELGSFAARPPVKPVTLGALADADADDD